jgi:transcriptional regulator with XRE-family HTH domain
MDPRIIKFGQHLREIRKQQGLSQEDLADLSCLHRTYVGAVERGERNVSLFNILRLADALKVSPALFFTEMCEAQNPPPAC